MKDIYTDNLNEIKEICSELTKENKKSVLAVAQALYFAQNTDGAMILQNTDFSHRNIGI